MPIVSVICTTYNQKDYIEKALSSIVSQKTSFLFEVIVHDDASTDGTSDIIKEFEREYPELVKPIYEFENQYSQGINIFLECCLPYCNGKYIAICEGDDYWIDDHKLQKQYDIMERNMQLDTCACRASVICDIDETEIYEIRPQKHDSILSIEAVILGGGRYLATASLLFRKKLFNSLMPFERILFFDYTSQIKGALRGGIYYLDDKMTVYRSESKGSWSVRVEKNKDKIASHLEKEMEMLRQFDYDTNKEFHEVIEKRLKAYTPFVDQLEENKSELFKEIESKRKSPHRGIYLWGIGRRGEAFQEFCRREGYDLNGVCDKRNHRIGELTEQGFPIYETNFVLSNGGLILASNELIYQALESNINRQRLVNLQHFMQYS